MFRSIAQIVVRPALTISDAFEMSSTSKQLKKLSIDFTISSETLASLEAVLKFFLIAS